MDDEEISSQYAARGKGLRECRPHLCRQEWAESHSQNVRGRAVFPEGARTFTGHMGKFRRGAFGLADELQLPVVPITIDGSFDVLPRQKGINFVTWHRLRLVIHAPIEPSSQGPEDIQRILEQSYETIMGDLPAKYQGFVENTDQ